MGSHGFSGGSGPVGVDHLSKPSVEGDSYVITARVAAFVCFQGDQRSGQEPQGISAEPN